MKIVLHMHRGDAAVETRLHAMDGLDVVNARDEAHFAAEIADADAAVVSASRYTAGAAAAVRNAPRLRWIQSAAAGYDPLVRHGVPEGVAVTNASGVWGPTVAEHAMSLLFALVRALPRAERNRTVRDYDREATSDAVGSVEGGTALVVGFGSIGREVAIRARAFGMRVVGVNQDGRAVDGADRMIALARLPEMLPEADAVILCIPLSDATRHLIAAGELDAMRDTAILVNVGRGQLVDQAALIEALRAGRIAGAGLDVFDPEPLPADSALWDLPNVVLTPHVGGYAPASFARLADLVADNVGRLRAGAPLARRIDPSEFGH